MDNKYDNQIALWKRQPRETDKPGTKYPHYTGKASINGTPKQAAAWLNTPQTHPCLLYTSPSPRDGLLSRMPSSA